jgi:hypothetical protein
LLAVTREGEGPKHSQGMPIYSMWFAAVRIQRAHVCSVCNDSGERDIAAPGGHMDALTWEGNGMCTRGHALLCRLVVQWQSGESSKMWVPHQASRKGMLAHPKQKELGIPTSSNAIIISCVTISRLVV